MSTIPKFARIDRSDDWQKAAECEKRGEHLWERSPYLWHKYECSCCWAEGWTYERQPAVSVPPNAAIEVIEYCESPHKYDCERGPLTHDWRRVDPDEFPTTPDAEFVCNGCSALGRMIRPHGAQL